MVKKKYFSLLYGDTVHEAPQGKIIPAKEFSKALSAVDLLSKVHEEVDRYREEVAKECEKLKVQAQQEGFQEGFVQWAQHMANFEAEMAKANKATEKMIIPVALKAARKIVGREIELSEKAIVDIVSSKLKTVKQSKQVVVHVCPADFQALDNHRSDLVKVFENLETLSIRPNEDVKSGGCIIETETGIINAQLDKQWEILEQAFKSMLT